MQIFWFGFGIAVLSGRVAAVAADKSKSFLKTKGGMQPEREGLLP